MSDPELARELFAMEEWLDLKRCDLLARVADCGDVEALWLRMIASQLEFTRGWVAGLRYKVDGAR